MIEPDNSARSLGLTVKFIKVFNYIKLYLTIFNYNYLAAIEEAVNPCDVDASSVGSRVVFSAPFTGGKRYMFNNFMMQRTYAKYMGILTCF